MNRFLIILTSLTMSLTAFAGLQTVSDADLIKAVKADTIASSAFAEAQKLGAGGCKTTVTKRPKASFENFEMIISCFEEADEVTGGGEFLRITISGQYWDQKSVDVQKIEIMRAG